MPIVSNAERPSDVEAAKAYIKRVGKGAKGHKVEMDFASRYVTITVDGEPQKVTRKRFERWADDGFPSDDPIPIPTAKAEPRPVEPAEGEATVPTPIAEATPRPKVGPAIEIEPSFIDELADEALSQSLEEQGGEEERNTARFKRGESMLRLAGVAQASQQKMKDMLDLLNQRLLEKADANSLLGVSAITEQEATMTRKVVEAFGSSGEFRVVDAINPHTGDPLVNDAGEPFVRRLTQVALNKLYPLVEAAEGHFDEVVSFAFRYSEKTVKKAKSVAKATNTPLIKVIKTVNKQRFTSVSPITGEKIKVQLEDKLAYDFLRGLVGEEPTDGVVSIKTVRSWYEAFWVPMLNLMSAAAGEYAPSLVSQNTGRVSNVFALEQTISQFFNVHEDEGVNRVLAAMVRSETITEAQAHEFMDSFALSEEGEWVRVSGGDEAVAEAAEEFDDEEEFVDDDTEAVEA